VLLCCHCNSDNGEGCHNVCHWPFLICGPPLQVEMGRSWLEVCSSMNEETINFVFTTSHTFIFHCIITNSFFSQGSSQLRKDHIAIRTLNRTGGHWRPLRCHKRKSLEFSPLQTSLRLTPLLELKLQLRSERTLKARTSRFQSQSDSLPPIVPIHMEKRPPLGPLDGETSQDTLPMTLDELHNTISEFAIRTINRKEDHSDGISDAGRLKSGESGSRRKRRMPPSVVIRERRPPRTLSASILSDDIISSRHIVNRSKKLQHSLTKSLRKASKKVSMRRSKLKVGGERDEIQEEIESKGRKLMKARDSLRKMLDKKGHGDDDHDDDDDDDDRDDREKRGRIGAGSSEDLIVHMGIREVIRSEMHGFLAEFFAQKKSSRQYGGGVGENDDGINSSEEDWMQLLRQWIRIEVAKAFDERERRTER
jgi:hypothetical protein